MIVHGMGLTKTPHIYKDILKSVSRSFYLSLRVLPAPMRPIMSMGYLLCRTADTIADTEAIPVKDRLQMLMRFRTLFQNFPLSKSLLNDFVQDLIQANTTPTTSEGKLLNNFKDTANAFNQLPKTDQALIQEVVLAVIAGMEIDLKNFGSSKESLKAFVTTDELENYIHHIGGEPGRFWTKVCLAYGPSIQIKSREKWIEDGIAFGKGLQMVNILRDIPEDIQNGRCYIPSTLLKEHDLVPQDLLNDEKLTTFLTLYHNLIDQTIDRLSHGYRYIDQFPENNFRLKAAVWWPLSIGLKTLGRLRQNKKILSGEKSIKVSRGEIYALMGSSLLTLNFKKQMERDYKYMVGLASSSVE